MHLKQFCEYLNGLRLARVVFFALIGCIFGCNKYNLWLYLLSPLGFGKSIFLRSGMVKTGEAPGGNTAGSASSDVAPDAILRKRVLHLIEDLDRPRAEIVLDVMLGLVRLSATQAGPRFANGWSRVDPTLRLDSRLSNLTKTAQPNAIPVCVVAD